MAADTIAPGDLRFLVHEKRLILAKPPYRYVLCSSSEEVNQSDWDAVCSRSDNPFVRLPFIRAVERSMRDPGKYWFALFYDAADQPVACACFSLFVVDGAMLAPEFIQGAIRWPRKFIPWYFKFRILLCGLPVSTASDNLAVVPEADWDEFTRLLAEIAEKLARQERVWFVSFKEYDKATAEKLRGLTDRGYHCANSVLIYTLDTPFQSFDEYYESRSKRTRANMRKYFHKFAEAGMRYECRSGSEGIEQLYTEDVHRLYEAVYERAEVKFEKLSPEFFPEVARQFPESSRFTLMYQEEQIVGFCCALADGRTYHILYCGIDYELNRQGDIYFNLLYRALEDGMAGDVDHIHIGASSDEFKRRLGCTGTQLFIHVKAIGTVPSLIFNAVARFLFEG